MKRPVLVIMAAGMGSRYGGLKQIDPVDEQGHIIMDFSLYDAVEAGFQEVIFIIKREYETEFREAIGDRLSNFVKVHYVYQELTDIPEGFKVPEGRVKPWGTGHAVLSCIYVLNEAPFAVINADDYYGKHAFSLIYEYLTQHQDDEKYQYAMVGYRLGNTLTENGHVSRGICRTDACGYLKDVCEHTHIEKAGEKVMYTEDDGRSFREIASDSIVSMNLWGFTDSFLDELQNRFARFLTEEVPKNPMKAEYFLPTVVNELLKEDKSDVQVMLSEDRWYGVTYKEDKPMVVEAISRMKKEGLYPEHLWR